MVAALSCQGLLAALADDLHQGRITADLVEARCLDHVVPRGPGHARLLELGGDDIALTGHVLVGRERRHEIPVAEREQEGKKSFQDMLAYVDENGNLSDTPPDPDAMPEFKLEEISLDASFREAAPDNGTRQGKVKFFNEDKGYGFIVDKKNHDSIFVHANDLEPGLKLRQNEHVTFEIEPGNKGAKAVNVQLAV